jgi:hypothetical protein
MSNALTTAIRRLHDNASAIGTEQEMVTLHWFSQQALPTLLNVASEGSKSQLGYGSSIVASAALQVFNSYTMANYEKIN